MPKQMRVFYDTEFLEDGHTIDLISIGMVREDGKEFYAVSDEFNKKRVAKDEWLMENVMSSIDHRVIQVPAWEATEATKELIHVPNVPSLFITDPAKMSRQQIADGILEFVSDIWPEFWAWYGAYDHVALCQLYGKMINLPKNFPMFTCDIRQEAKRIGAQREMPEQPEGAHNALADAKFNVVRYEYLRSLTK